MSVGTSNTMQLFESFERDVPKPVKRPIAVGRVPVMNVESRYRLPTQDNARYDGYDVRDIDTQKTPS